MTRSASVVATVCGMVLVSFAVTAVPTFAASKPVLTASKDTVREGARDGNATVALTLDRLPRSATEVSWRTVDGTAKAGKDYKKKNGVVVFKGHRRTRTIRVPIIDDARPEKTERFSVKIRSSDARVPKSVVTITIKDNDPSGFDVTLATDAATSHAFDQQVSDEDPTLVGATMTTTGPDGTVYTLSVPDGALDTETTVTMTPWKSATGTGITGGRLVGVRLTPSGTTFLEALKLRVDPPGPDAVPAVTFAHESGDDIYGYPTTLATNRVEMSLTHFSDYGGYLGDGISIQVVDPEPVDPAQALAAEMELTLREERNRLLQGKEADPAVMEKVATLMKSYYDNVVAPKLGGIRTDCSQAKASTGLVLGFGRQASLLGVLGTQTDTIFAAVTRGAENCLEEAMGPCVDKDDAAQIKEILAHWRQVLLLGGTVPGPDPFDPSRECKQLLAGTLTVTVHSVLEVNGFRTTESWTLGYHPRMVHASQSATWYDDGRGSWTVTGSYLREDLRPGAQCATMIESTYSGGGTLFTSPHNQLDPATDRGKAIAELAGFWPASDNNLGLTPAFDGEAVGTETTTFYDAGDDGCVSRTDEKGHWFSPNWGPSMTAAPGTVVGDSQSTRGTQFDYSFTRDQSDATKTDTYQASVVGSLMPTLG